MGTEAVAAHGSKRMKFFRDNGLSVALLALFLACWVAQAAVGVRERNKDARSHGEPVLSFVEYLRSEHFLEATFENWESEFLQMAAYVVLTAHLFQRGSAESKDPDKKPAEEKITSDSPGPVQRGGWWKKIYEHSLSLTLAGLFIGSWVGHALSGMAEYNSDLSEHGQSDVSFGEFLTSSRFWFESFQNWQSEFLAVAAIVILSIWLREKNSPESKSVASPHKVTGRSG